jgi:hydrogenase-4 transcriptional activator
MQLLLSLWREASRHVELRRAVERMGELVARQLPVRQVTVRRLEPREQVVETLAVWRAPGSAAPRRARHHLASDATERITAWSRDGGIESAAHRGAGWLAPLVVPEDVPGAVVLGPLVTDASELGLLLLVFEPGVSPTPEHEQVAATLLEPFAVALGHNRRFEALERTKAAMEAENQALLSRLHRQDIVETVVGADGTLRAVMERAQQVAPTDAPVLILGETGTGKEVVARAIHRQSNRRDGPIVRVNCGAIPSELIDSELFGHEKGSFTGAIATRKGWFERAHSGTLFLDEIAELSLAAQVRLLRVLQDGSFERVGGQETLTADVRIVAATHRDMDQLVAEGRFREDLWYRISVFPIYLPPLRARRDDIPALARHFAKNAGLRFGGAPLEPTQADLDLLAEYPWPGNVREMAAVMERAAILGGGHRLDLRGAMETRLYAVRERLAQAARAAEPAEGARARLDDVVRRHIQAALRAAGGRVEGPRGAAKALGLNPSTLRGKMRKLGIRPEP